jgi:hypothetical protein
MKSASLAAALWAAMLGCCSLAHAGGADSAGFNVKVRLEPSPVSQCTTTSLAINYQAEVRVVCGTNQVVDIRLPSGFTGFSPRHGGAGNYLVGQGPRYSGGLIDNTWGVGLGTITALHVVNNAQLDSLEILVSW